ncbi:hypothetical protein CVT26_004193 [Gymnopilus dilepis]|uniref:Uncharacterized protein n=1 Tax=Gymnopilus dilepis TaxID=231916 RepID=A0A409YMK2_9AGAR|nr:hypothetical protein CVT26_004193 [Gymnopilus dilepis]
MTYFLRGRSGKPSSACQVKPIQIAHTVDFRSLLMEAETRETQTFIEDETSDVESNILVQQSAAEPSAAQAESSTQKGPLSFKRSHEEGFPEAKKVSGSHRRRRTNRNEKIVAEGHTPHPKAYASILKAATPLETELETSELPATTCGTQALHYTAEEGKDDLHLQELLDDGISCPILDAEERVVGAFCGRVSDPGYLEACQNTYKLFEAAGEHSGLKEDAVDNRRGYFPVINIGITHGKGTRHPVNLHEGKNSPSKYESLAREILHDPSLNRIADFQSSCFKIWSPNVHTYYCENLDKLYKKLPYLRRNFEKSVFPCCAVNCGPKAWTCRHRDSMNLPFGMCAITALGCFDHRKGGHLVLPDLKLIIEFPVGCVILIPSATLIHANIPIQAHETRASFTQFAAGGLFRYIANGFMTEKALQKKDKKKYEQVRAEKKTRWSMGLKLLSKFSELAVSSDPESDNE